MPGYDYRCAGCGNTFTVMMSTRAKEITKCPRCGSPSLKQVSASTGAARGKERVTVNRCGCKG